VSKKFIYVAIISGSIFAQTVYSGEKKPENNGGVVDPIVKTIVVKNVKANIEGSKRENGVVNKVIKGGTGVSVKDIKKHGVFGGSNSVFRKPFG